MSDAPVPPAAHSAVDDLLVESKLRAPEPRHATASRRTLIDRARASGSKVVTVTAPAGYGKSTMLAEWAAHEARSVAWVSLDESDDDPAVLLRSLAAACARVSAPAAAVVADMRSMAGSTLGRAAPLLSAALSATAHPFVLLVDDVHAAGSPGCRDVLDVVMGRIPAHSQVVLAGRHEQPYLAPRRAAGEIFEISARDLRLDLAGARTIFDQAGVAVPDVDLVRAWERCEGWPAGIYLCALIARDGGHVVPVGGDDRYIADYLYRECVERLPDDTQAFLRRTAVLDQLSAAVCDALLDATGSQRRLHELETLNLFLIPLDRSRGWYRYHALFREFLLAELQRLEGDRVADLHRRASSWYEANHTLAPAIEHSLAAGDRAGAVLLATKAALPMYQVGQVGMVSRWLAELGEDAVAGHPPLLALACWKALLMGESAEAERWASLLERTHYTGDSPDDERAHVSARAMIRAAMCADGPQRALADAELAVASEPPWSPWRDQAVHLHGSALLLAGDVAGAETAFVDASALAAVGNPDSIVLCKAELAVLAIDRSDWTRAAEHAGTALTVLTDNHMAGYATAALAYAVSARVAWHEGDRAGAHRLLAQGMRARVLCTYVLPFLSLRVRLQLAKAYAATGDHTAATALAEEMADILRRRPHVGVLADEVEAYRRKLDQRTDTRGTVPLTPAELRLLPYLQTHLTLTEIGQRLHVSRNTVGSQTTSIYRKLGVSSRSAAVERATDAGLLGS